MDVQHHVDVAPICVNKSVAAVDYHKIQFINGKISGDLSWKDLLTSQYVYYILSLITINLMKISN